jgi:hypothetical protein
MYYHMAAFDASAGSTGPSVRVSTVAPRSEDHALAKDIFLIGVPDADMLVAARVGEPPNDHDVVWTMTRDGGNARWVKLETQGARAHGATSSAVGTFLATDKGLLSLKGNAAIAENFLFPELPSLIYLGPPGPTGPVQRVWSDGAGDVWFEDIMLYVVSPHGKCEHTWGARKLDGPYWIVGMVGWLVSIEITDWPPPKNRWKPESALVGDATQAASWWYRSGKESSVLRRIDEAGLPDEQGAVGRAVTSSAPRLSKPLLESDDLGRLWLAGESAGEARVYLLDKTEKFIDVTPPADLLGKAHITGLTGRHTHGKLYAATDTAGILVYDGQRWAPHPVNASLPNREGHAGKRVDCIYVDDKSNLWVGCGDTIVRWSENN